MVNIETLLYVDDSSQQSPEISKSKKLNKLVFLHRKKVASSFGYLCKASHLLHNQWDMDHT
jgi:hypothetical protein